MLTRKRPDIVPASRQLLEIFIALCVVYLITIGSIIILFNQSNSRMVALLEKMAQRSLIASAPVGIDIIAPSRQSAPIVPPPVSAMLTDEQIWQQNTREWEAQAQQVMANEERRALILQQALLQRQRSDMGLKQALGQVGESDQPERDGALAEFGP